MTLLFVDSHNMISILEKSDAAQGFGIQLWSGAWICLPNDEIFVGLVRMGYEKPSTKLTFYKEFFSTKWKFFIHMILHSSSAKRTSWNEFSSAMASALICISSGQRFNFSKVGKGFSGVETPLFENMLVVRAVDVEEEVHVPTQDDVVQENVIEEVAAEDVPPTPTSPSPPSPVIPSSPPHQSPSPPQSQAAEGSSHLVQQILDKCSALVLGVKGLENANAAQQLEIIKLKARVKKLERLNKVKSSKLRCLKKVGTSQRVKSSEDVENVFNQGRISVDVETDEGIELEVDQEKDAQVERRHADTQAEIYNIDLDHSSKVAAASTHIPTVKPVAKPKVLKIVAAPVTRKIKGVVIRDPEEELHVDTPAETPTVKDKGKARKNMISYLKNTEGFKMELFKGKTYDQILPIFQARFDANMKFLFKSREEMEKKDKEIIKSINETPAHKAAKRRKLNEEAQEADNLRRCLEIVPNEDDDVFVETVPLAQKAPVVDNQRIVKDRFSTKKPTNFSDEYLLLTLKTMFGELDEQDVIWRNQKSVYDLSLVKRWKLLTSCGVHVIILSTVQLFLLVKRRYPLSRFTLEQLVNVARLQVEKESEMSLELLRFTKQQLLEYQQGR
nr:hypothetical protein [Tanacetum cinerariifolium]